MCIETEKPKNRKTEAEPKKYLEQYRTCNFFDRHTVVRHFRLDTLHSLSQFTLSLSLSLFLSLSRILPLSLFLSHMHKHTHSFYFSLSHTHSPSLSRSHRDSGTFKNSSASSFFFFLLSNRIFNFGGCSIPGNDG